MTSDRNRCLRVPRGTRRRNSCFRRTQFRPLPCCLLCSLLGPALAQAQSVANHPAAHIDIGTLRIDSDFTVFMHRDVPEDVRRMALRRLWVLMDHTSSLASDPAKFAPSVLRSAMRWGAPDRAPPAAGRAEAH